MIHIKKMEENLCLGLNIISDDDNAILNIKFLFKQKDQVIFFRLRIRKLKVFLACKQRKLNRLFLYDYTKETISPYWYNYLA